MSFMTEETTIALVTGANKGIGRAVAEQLAGLGMTVLLGSRDPGRGKEAAEALRAAGGDVHEIVLDVLDPATIEQAAARTGDEYGRLDILVNNAGISGTSVGGQYPGNVDLAAVRTVFETNLFGVIAVTEAMLPLLRRSGRARIVNISSGTGSLGLMSDPGHYFATRPGAAGYPVSKAALNMLTVQYANAFGRDPALSRIRINSATPGYVATDMTGHRGTRTVEEGARVIVHLATLPADGPTGGFFNDMGAVPW
jgi:NAD(P)-dependent dehydrogenase (short-subunit alcohol dehydrogenase family)